MGCLRPPTLNQWVQGPERQRHSGEPFPFHATDIDLNDRQALQDERGALRRELRRRRRALTTDDQQRAARALCRQLRCLPEVQRARRVALYLPNDAEIDVSLLLPWLKRRGAKAYLPVLRPLSDNRLWFVHYHDATPMVTNRFGIQEPHSRHSAHRARRLPPWALDLVLLPLVGFDDQGNRMGMGGGFYDRSFAFARSRTPRPRLIGVAHDCQRMRQLPIASWDVPLDAIVSDVRVIRPKNENGR